MNKIRHKLFAILFSAITILSVSGEIVLSETEWDLGEIGADAKFPKILKIENNGNDPVKLSLMSTCGCLTVKPGDFIIEPGAEVSSEMIFDSSDDTGEFEKVIIVRSTDPALPKAFFPVKGTVLREVNENRQGNSNEAVEEGVETLSSGAVRFEYYYSPSCRECRIFLAEKVPEMSKRLGVDVLVNGRDIQDSENYEELLDRLRELGIEAESFPVAIVEKVVLQGEKEIDSKLENLLEEITKGEIISPVESTVSETADHGTKAGREGLKFFPVLLAGLLDGVNPCAFTTLIFLLTALAVAGKSRREIVIIGTFFTLSVYITYYLVGLGFFRVLRMAESFTVISSIIRWLLVIILIVFSGLSFYDYYKVRKNKVSEIVLQLPKGMKKRIHRSVRTYTRSTALVGSSIIMGFLVSIFELGCTGQIYFPTITYMIKTEGQLSGYLMLALYNLAFIIPLVLIFFITYRGVSSDKVTEIFRKNLGAVKLVTALLFLILAFITVLT